MTALAAQETVRLLLVCGSLRAGSTNAGVLKTVQAVAPGGVETASYDAWINALERPLRPGVPTRTSRRATCSAT